MKETQEIQKPNTVSMQRAVEVAEIESQIATAKRYPRDIKVFKDKLMTLANIDQETAESCYYALPRGGKAIDGPSIRLAEIALSCYGNCVAEADVLEEDDRFIYAMGQCRDLENNVAVRMKVRRRITNRDGKRFNDDMIAVTANAACAIALRNAIFKVVPGAYLKPVFEKCKRTAVGKAESLANRRAEVIKRLMRFGVTEDRILQVINRRTIDEVTFDDIAVLIGLGTAIKDEDTTVEEAFPPIFDEAQKEATEKIKAESGSVPVDTGLGESDPESKAKADKLKADLAAADKKAKGKGKKTKTTTPKKDKDAKPKYHCNNCGRNFDVAKNTGPKGVQCECLSWNVVLNEPKKKPAFMEDEEEIDPDIKEDAE